MIRFKISGSRSQTIAARELLLTSGADIQMSPLQESKDGLRPAKTRLEPLTYFLVVVAGHLTASLAHDFIKSLRAKNGRAPDVTIEEDPESEVDRQDDPNGP